MLEVAKIMKKIVFYLLILLFLVCYSIQNEAQAEQTKQTPRLNFINAAYKYLKTPYKYAGTTSNGMDCSGLVYKTALEALNISLPRSSSGIAKFAKRIKDSEIQQGDLLFFVTTSNKNKISHVAIYIGSGEFIHSASHGPKTGVIISSLNEKYWKSCYRFAGRIIQEE